MSPRRVLPDAIGSFIIAAMFPAFATMIARVVPLLLVASACLIVARLARDRLARRNEAAGRTVFVAIVAATAALAIFVLIQTSLLMMARIVGRQNAARLDRWYSAYTTMHGRVTPVIAFDWAMALMMQRRWNDARARLMQTGTPSAKGVRYNADSVLLIGETFFYSGDMRRAEQALVVARRTTHPYVRFYLLGRIAAARGDTSRALEFLAMSLQSNGRFFPAFYHRQRLLMTRGEFERARTEMNTTRGEVDTQRNQQWKLLEQALATQAVPPSVEFYVIEV